MISTILLIVGCLMFFQGFITFICGLVQCVVSKKSESFGISNVACLVAIIMIVLSFKI
jgi:hypothetical protein